MEMSGNIFFIWLLNYKISKTTQKLQNNSNEKNSQQILLYFPMKKNNAHNVREIDFYFGFFFQSPGHPVKSCIICSYDHLFQSLGV